MKKHISCRFNVNKKYSTCERVGDSPSIGNVDNGVDTEAIKKYYLHEYEESKRSIGGTLVDLPIFLDNYLRKLII